jgi:hypothetical protein
MSFSTIVIVLLCLLLTVVVYYLFKFAFDLIEIEDRINSSLEDLDKSYEVFDEISKKPVFFDSLEIRQCLQEINKTREVLLGITANLREVSSQKELLKNKELNETDREEEGSQAQK